MSKTTFLIAFMAVVVFIGFNSIYIVNEGQQTVKTQFGDPVGEKIVNAGLYFKIPFGIQKIRYFDKRILKWDGDPNEIPTKNKQYIWLDTTARWRITDPLLFMQRLGNERRADIALSDLINGAVRDFVTKNDLIEIIRSSDWSAEYNLTGESTAKKKAIKVGRDQFSQLVLNSASANIQSFGIELLDVLVKRVNYTRKVRETTYNRMISERKRIAAERRSEGESQKAEILGTMEKELKTISSTAYRTAEEIRGNADAEVTKLYGRAYGKDPEFYRFMTTLESYKEVMGQNTRLVIDSSSPLYQFLQGGK